MIIGEETKIRIHCAFELGWEAIDKQVAARPFSAISLRLIGDCVMTDGEKTERLKTGDVLYMPSGVSYRSCSSYEKIAVIHFDAYGEAPREMRVFRMENTANIHRIFSSLIEVWERKPIGYYARAMSLFYELIYELEKCESSELSADYEKLRPAVEKLHSSYTDPELNVDELCKTVFFSDTYFRRLFTRIYGKTPLKYINELRISHAKALLGETDYSVEAIAHLSGFKNVKYFSTAFKQSEGVTPSCYRNGQK